MQDSHQWQREGDLQRLGVTENKHFTWPHKLFTAICFEWDTSNFIKHNATNMHRTHFTNLVCQSRQQIQWSKKKKINPTCCDLKVMEGGWERTHTAECQLSTDKVQELLQKIFRYSFIQHSTNVMCLIPAGFCQALQVRHSTRLQPRKSSLVSLSS